MTHAATPSSPPERFRVLHALRIKGFAKAEVIAEIADLPVGVTREHLVVLQSAGSTSVPRPPAPCGS